MPFLPVDHQANGSIAANAQTVILDVTRHAIATVTLTGTWVGTVQFEVTTDNVTWVGIPVTPVAGGTTVTSATANGTWSVYVSAYAAVRLRASAWTSGSVAVAIRASAAGGSLTALTAGSIVFANASGVLAQDSGFTYDSTNHASKASNVIVNTSDYTMGYLGIGFADETKSTGALVVHGSPTSIYARPGYSAVYSFLDYEATAITSDGTAGGVNQTAATTVGLVGVQSRIAYGATAAAFGSVIGVHSNIGITSAANNGNEYAAFFANIVYDPAFATNAGRVWGTDWTFEGPNGVRPNALGGIHSVVNNFYNGSPDGFGTITQPATHSGTLSVAGTFYDPETTGTTDSPSGAIWALTGQHKSQAITTYPVDVGIGITGTSGPNVSQFVTNTGVGFTVGMQIGGSGSNWANVGSHLKYGMWIGDYDTFGILISRQYSGAAASTPAIAVKAGAGPVIIGATAQAHLAALELTGKAWVQADVDASVPLVLEAHSATQSADLLQWTNATPTKLGSITKMGSLDLGGVTGLSPNPAVNNAGDKIVMGGTTGASTFGIGYQVNRLVAFVPSANGFAVRPSSGSGHLSSGTDAIVLFGDGHAVLNGNLSVGQSATAPDPTTGGTIATANVGVARVAPAGAETGMILAVGTIAGQEVTVINEAVAANSITFAAQATSHVSNGVSTVIAGLTAQQFVWDTGTSLWYPA